MIPALSVTAIFTLSFSILLTSAVSIIINSAAEEIIQDSKSRFGAEFFNIDSTIYLFFKRLLRYYNE